LSEAIELVKKLYDKAGKSKLSPLAAVGELGYAGLSGASLTALGALRAYGLVESERGTGVTVSPLAIKLLHPTDHIQEGFARKEAALFPKVLLELYSDGFRDTNEDVIRNHLIQKGFKPRKAGVAASVYIANFAFANLSDDGRLKEKVEAKEAELAAQVSAKAKETNIGSQASIIGGVVHAEDKRAKNMLATYSVPLGSNEATITFTGEKLSVEDFDALGDFVDYCKKQFERKQAAEKTAKSDAVKNAANQELALAG
jgi:hypothetical protein